MTSSAIAINAESPAIHIRTVRMMDAICFSFSVMNAKKSSTTAVQQNARTSLNYPQRSKKKFEKESTKEGRSLKKDELIN